MKNAGIKCLRLSAAFLVVASLLAGHSSSLARETSRGAVLFDETEPVIEPFSKGTGCQAGGMPMKVSGTPRCVKCEPQYMAMEIAGKARCLRTSIRPNIRKHSQKAPILRKPHENKYRKCDAGFKAIKVGGKLFCAKCGAGSRLVRQHNQFTCVFCGPGEINWLRRCLVCPYNSRHVRTTRGGPGVCQCAYKYAFGKGPKGYGCYLAPVR